MAEIDYYYPFDSINGDRKTSAATERRFFNALFTDGVVGSNSFPITSESAGVYTIGAGVAIIGGAIGGIVNAKTITAKPAAGAKVFIVLRLDTTSGARKITLEVVNNIKSATAQQLDEGGQADLPLYSVTGQMGGSYGLLDQRQYCTSFDNKQFAELFAAMLSAMQADGEAQLGALAQQFEAQVQAAQTENAGLYGAAGRQGFINPTFTVNQRGRASYSIASGSAYTFDRWKAVVSGSALASDMVIQTEQDGARHALKINAKKFSTAGTANVGRAGFLQNIEGGVRTFCAGGKSFTVSFDAKAEAACALGVDARQIAQSGGSGIDLFKTVNITTEWKRYSVTFKGTVTPTASQVSDVLQIAFYVSFKGYTRYGTDQDADNTVYFANMQINEGTSALPCYVKPYADELEACQRYYIAFGKVSLAVGAVLATNNQVITSPLPITRRLFKLPTATFTDRANVSGAASVEVSAGGWRNGLVCILSNNSDDAPVFVVTNTDSAGVTRVCFNSLAIDAEMLD